MTAEAAGAATGATPGVYYSGNYWNNRPEVLAHLNRRATGDHATPWYRHLAAWRGAPFTKSLSFNCGNGWVERDLVGQGIVTRGVGLDIDPALLTSARADAAAAGLPIEYELADTNTSELAIEGVDLVVNYAAGHHVARIDRLFRRLAALLGPNGVFVSWDYTGPHRNQYTALQWEALHELNATLPARLRKDLVYPHVPTMLATDPSEAVHSELVLSTMRRYFDLRHLRHLGGGLAYELLTFNDGFFDPAVDTSAEVDRILAADEAFTDADPERRSLFSYVIATPKVVPYTEAELAAWSAEEDERERNAAANGGRYGEGTLIGNLTERIETAERELRELRNAPVGNVEALGRRADRLARRVGVRAVHTANRFRPGSGPAPGQPG